MPKQKNETKKEWLTNRQTNRGDQQLENIKRILRETHIMEILNK